jgi:hypothetical protein
VVLRLLVLEKEEETMGLLDPTNLCCHSCAPVLALSHWENIPKELIDRATAEGLSPDQVLEELEWKNPYEPGTRTLKEEFRGTPQLLPTRTGAYG